MANTLRFKRGLASGLPTGLAGEPLFTTDTFDLYIGNGTGNTRFQKFIASGTTSQLLRGDGSLLTMPIVLSSPANGEVLKYNGTNWVNSNDAGITGSGVAGQVAYFTGATTQGGSNNLFWDATNNRLGIGTNTPLLNLQINSVTGSNSTLAFSENGVLKYYNRYIASTGAYQIVDIPSVTTRLQITSNGNVQINSLTDNGLRFQVTGDTSLTGSGNTSATTALSVRNSASTNILTVKNNRTTNIISDAGQLNIASSADATNGLLEFDANSSASQTLFVQLTRGTVGLGTTGNQTAVRINGGFSPTSGTATWHNLHINPVINQTGGANGITRAIYIQPSLTAAADWRSIEWNNSTGWGLYGAGTAANYLAGSLGIGNTSLTGVSLAVTKNITGVSSPFGIVNNGTIQSDATGTVEMYNSTANTQAASFTITNLWHYRATQGSIGAGSSITTQVGFLASSAMTNGVFVIGFRGQIASGANRFNLYMDGTAVNYLNGNTLIGTTTDAGFKLDVNGTMRVSGASTITNGTLPSLKINHTASGHASAWFDTNEFGLLISSASTSASHYLVNMTSNSISRFRVGCDGAATFSSSVTADSGTFTKTYANTSDLGVIVSATIPGINLRTVSTGRSSFIQSYISSGVASILVGTGTNNPTTQAAHFVGSDGAVVIGVWPGSSTGHNLQVEGTMRATGAATFSSNVGIGGTPTQRLDVQGSANSIQARFGNVAGRGLTIGTTAISGTNDAGVVFNAPTATDGTLVFQTSSTDRMTLNSSGLNVATAIAIGTTPDTNLPFKILKNINSTVGIRFENTSTGASAYSAVQFGTDVTGGTAFTNMVYGSSGITESGVYKPNGTSIINTGSGGLNFLAVSQPIRFFTSTGNGTLRAEIANDGFINHYTGTAPSTNLTDGYRQYSADITAGNAAPHFRTENGGIIKLYQQTTGVTSATYIGGAGTGLTDSDTFDGYTIAQIVKALRNAGLLA